MVMRFDLHRPDAAPTERPLVGNVEALDSARPGHSEDRDEAIISLLREKLKGRQPAPKAAAPRPGQAPEPTGEDKYEPQRLNRKIVWQYDSTARKVPLLRRHYI